MKGSAKMKKKKEVFAPNTTSPFAQDVVIDLNLNSLDKNRFQNIGVDKELLVGTGLGAEIMYCADLVGSVKETSLSVPTLGTLQGGEGCRKIKSVNAIIDSLVNAT
ncbi:hypothetical protein V6N12_010564 [Hibiscus sabdariffa]|uniref:Uncharacterized protein n=1 Tax=Hibiscus sabdariffa TaxID=183260 RepID=A0ABR2EP89_9ROSI